MVDRNISVLKEKKRVGYVAAVAVSDSISHANFILQIHDVVVILCVFLQYKIYTYLYIGTIIIHILVFV